MRVSIGEPTPCVRDIADSIAPWSARPWMTSEQRRNGFPSHEDPTRIYP